MRAEIITVGTELTLGLSIDTNSAYLARRLAREGITCNRQTSVADDLKEMTLAINDVFSRSEILIITGGLGPTVDDLTRDAIARVFDRRLIFHEDLAQMLRDKFAAFGQQMPELVLRQAYLPEGAKPILPVLGTAPGIILEQSDKIVLALPGVPLEMQEMCEEAVNVIKQKFKQRDSLITIRVIKTYGASEAFIEDKVEDIIKTSENPRIGILAHLGEVYLELIVAAPNKDKAKKISDGTEKKILKRLGDLVFGFDEDSLESVVSNLLKKHSLKIAVAESCTGGLLGNKLTDVPGSSDYFLGGVTTYANEMKVRLAQVSARTIKKHGAVSAETATEMASGIRKATGADVGLSTTGIAGPSGGTSSKPVGLVFIGISTAWEERAERFLFTGERLSVKRKAAGAALNLLRLSLLKLGKMRTENE